MPPSNLVQDNRTVSAAVLSPELVLVSPPEEAARARQLLWDTVPPAAAAPKRAVAIALSGSSASGASLRGAALFDAICVAGTLGPLLLAVFSR